MIHPTRYFFMILLGIICFNYCAKGQELFRKHSIGIRGGAGVSTLQGNSQFNKAIVRLHAGMSYEYRPHHNWGVETGVYLQTKGGAETYDGVKAKLDLWYLELPVLCNYHIYYKQVGFIPFGGFYYGYCMRGESRSGGRSSSWMGECGYRRLKFSDWGVRLGGGISWRNLYFAIGYDIGLSNICVPFIGGTVPSEGNIRTGLFFTTVGWNF